MKKLLTALAAAVLLTGCAGHTSSQQESSSPESESTTIQQENSAPETEPPSENSDPTEETEPDTEETKPGTEETEPGTEETEPGTEETEPSTEETEPGTDEQSDPVTVNYAEDVSIPEDAEVFEFSAAGALQPVRTVFTADRTVTDLKVLALTYEDMDADGNVVFSIEELMTIPEFNADSVLKASLEYIGTIPNNGISYTDPATGKTRRFAVNMSGNDGSLFLWEF